MKPEIWEDEAVMKLSLEARLLFVGLITQADDEGRLKAESRLLLGQIYPMDDWSPDDINNWLAELAVVGLANLYSVSGFQYAELIGWKDNQKISHPGKSKIPNPPKPSASAGSGDSPESVARVSGDSPPSRTRGSDQGRDQGRDQGSRENGNPFDEIWERHPVNRKLDRAKADFFRLIEPADFAAVNAQHQKFCERWQHDDLAYVPELHNWLKNWRDEPRPVPRPSKAQAAEDHVARKMREAGLAS